VGRRRAGDLIDRVMLQRRGLDDNGDLLGPWENVPSAAEDQAWAAQIIRLKGGEPVMAQRLQGVQPAVIAVRANLVTRQADNSWRAIDKRTGQVHEFTDVSESGDRVWIEILATAKAGDRLPP
jgi:hypothetical protein